jgi:hypothetical protein
MVSLYSNGHTGQGGKSSTRALHFAGIPCATMRPNAQERIAKYFILELCRRTRSVVGLIQGAPSRFIPSYIYLSVTRCTPSIHLSCIKVDLLASHKLIEDHLGKALLELFLAGLMSQRRGTGIV